MWAVSSGTAVGLWSAIIRLQVITLEPGSRFTSEQWNCKETAHDQTAGLRPHNDHIRQKYLDDTAGES